ncbi:GGDEF domain-containing phosphodiesterase [Acholeplasma sp. OttesenSCG-928-E16]|nr:GGDEF domain-containing phosphodiesterase [Acholeplasma sp. OttesenSCG-928-E16]
MPEALQIVLTIVSVIVVGGLSFLLWRSIVKESRRNKEEKKLRLEGILTIPEFTSFVSAYITKVNSPFSLLYIDVDSFLEVGEAFGEDESYHTLEVLAKRIRQASPQNAKIGRFDTDTFVVFLNKDYDRLQILSLTNKIKEAISEPITIFEDTEISLTASIGIGFYPIHGETLKDLLKSLKLVNYTIKQNGGNAIKIYSAEDESEDLTSHMEYYYQIRSAIEQKQFQLYFQPIIDIENKKAYGVESLLRWNHPEHGVLAPNRFINIMEQSGDIYWVGLWGLETLIQAYYDFAKIEPDIKVSFNLSPKQLVNSNIAKDFSKIIKKYRINASNIILEISQFGLFDRQLEVMDNLIQLKELGFSIAIDGFGFDFNNLTKVGNLKLDILKLDKNFLTEEDTQAKTRFMEALVDIADENQMTVISEEIGEVELYEKALSYRIRIMQGYYLCRPKPKDEIELYLTKKEYLDVIERGISKADEQEVKVKEEKEIRENEEVLSIPAEKLEEETKENE